MNRVGWIGIMARVPRVPLTGCVLRLARDQLCRVVVVILVAREGTDEGWELRARVHLQWCEARIGVVLLLLPLYPACIFNAAFSLSLSLSCLLLSSYSLCPSWNLLPKSAIPLTSVPRYSSQWTKPKKLPWYKANTTSILSRFNL